MNFYDIMVDAADGSKVSMADFKGKVVLVVNTATGCGFTPHYEPIEKMYHTQFPQMKKADVNGENEIELFRYLKSQKSFEGLGKGPAALAMSMMLKKMDKNYKNTPDIKWNFTKFVIDRKGNVVARFEPTENMDKVRKCVEALM